jgi:hypothetical protein
MVLAALSFVQVQWEQVHRFQSTTFSMKLHCFVATFGCAPSSKVARITTGASGHQPESGAASGGAHATAFLFLKNFENMSLLPPFYVSASFMM